MKTKLEQKVPTPKARKKIEIPKTGLTLKMAEGAGYAIRAVGATTLRLSGPATVFLRTLKRR